MTSANSPTRSGKPQSDTNIGLVVVAAGRGMRAGEAEGPKQYRKLGTKAVIAHTVAAFSGTISRSNTVIVVHPDDHDILLEALGGFLGGIHAVNGGATRQDSVLAGLRFLASKTSPPGNVMIHDAARPLVSPAMLSRIADALPRGGETHGVLPVLPVSETLKRVGANGFVAGTADREGLALAQTPQAFALESILEIHEKAAAEAPESTFTDDASLYEWAGLPVRTVPGDRTNIKITYPQDFEAAIGIMTSNPGIPDVRTGNGYDVHVFGPGDHVMLCGVSVPHTQSLSGHSDADVGLHALTDALLATCGEGDIGDHFPPTDPQWRGAASSIFLEKAVEIVRRHGGTIMNADVSIIAEEPKIAPARLAMRQKLSSILQIDIARCSVKATTNEKMGFVGRREGIAAIATATVVFGKARNE